MQEPRTFFPNGKPISVIYFWLIPVVPSLAFLIKEGISLENFILILLFIALCSLELLPYKKPISVTILTNEKILQFKYYNCWGQQTLLTINLDTATVSFKKRLVNLNYRLFGKLNIGWRILLYNGNYFNNRITIRQDEEIGYSKQQLEEMIELITQCKS